MPILSASIAAAYKLGIFVSQMQRYTDIDPRCKPPPTDPIVLFFFSSIPN